MADSTVLESPPVPTVSIILCAHFLRIRLSLQIVAYCIALLHGTKSMWEQEGATGSLLSSVTNSLVIGAPDRAIEGGNVVEPLGGHFLTSTLEQLGKK